MRYKQRQTYDKQHIVPTYSST